MVTRSLHVLAPLLIAGCAVTGPTQQITAPSTSSIPSSCHARGALPDPLCTPGSLNPNVTQATIGQTICVRGWTATVRPPATYTDPLKIKMMAAYAIPRSEIRGFELDHLVALEVGGAPDAIANLWPESAQPVPGYHEKDHLENRLRELVCSGALPLDAAQKAIASDWTQAYRQYVGPLP